jgi:hypothetical protein
VKRSWRRRLLGRLVCARRGHRPVPFRTAPKHPGVFCSRCLEVRGGGRWLWTGRPLVQVSPSVWIHRETGVWVHRETVERWYAPGLPLDKSGRRRYEDAA